VFLGLYVLPQFAVIFGDFKIQLPVVTRVLLAVSRLVAPIAVGAAAAVVAAAVGWRVVQPTRVGRRLVDGVGLRLPVVGGVLRWNMVARWCDALRLAVEAGIDLPGGIVLANDAVASPALARDAERVWKMIESGEAVRGAMTVRLRVMPPTVPAAIGLASERYDLPATLGNLAEMYQRQAELRMGSIPTILAPVLLVTVAVMIGGVVVSIVSPLLVLMRSFMR
jgi:type II secretory pathway component PulF